MKIDFVITLVFFACLRATGNEHSQKSPEAGPEAVERDNMADAYEGVTRGSLRLKGAADGGVKK